MKNDKLAIFVDVLNQKKPTIEEIEIKIRELEQQIIILQLWESFQYYCEYLKRNEQERTIFYSTIELHPKMLQRRNDATIAEAEKFLKILAEKDIVKQITTLARYNTYELSLKMLKGGDE